MTPPSVYSVLSSSVFLNFCILVSQFSHPRLYFQMEQFSDRKLICLALDIPVSSTTVPQEASQSTGGCKDVPTTSISNKRSGQRAYLQSLDRSSRAWVLSSGKSQASEDVCCPPEDSGSNIWYNPIPEEDAPCREGEVGRMREEREGEGGATNRVGSEDTRGEEGGVRSMEARSDEHPMEGANPSVSYCTDDITSELKGEN